jgi:hypothetical protein
MPRYNRIGDWLAGVGGGNPGDPASYAGLIVNGVLIDIGPGGGGSWLNDDEAAVIRYSSYEDFRFVAIHKATGAHRLLRPGVFGRTAAGGGRWATQHRDEGGWWRLDNGAPIPFPVIDFAQDDGALITQGHASNGTGLIVNPRFNDSGEMIEGRILSPNVVNSVHALSANHIAWRELDGPHVYGLPPITILPGESYQLRVAYDGIRWWVLYQASGYNGQLVLHPFNSFEGYALTSPGADAFRADLFFSHGAPLVVWATKEGEGVGQISGPWNVPLYFERRLLLKPAPPPTPPPSPPSPLPTPPTPPTPPPVPPVPPVPPPDDAAVPYEVFMSTERVGLRGPKGLFARIDPTESGQGMFGGFPIHFDREQIGPHETFELSKPDSLYALKHEATGHYLGFDATSYAEDLSRQFYTKSERYSYESPTVVKLPSGLVIAFKEYDHVGRKFVSAAVTVVKVAP